MVTARRGATKLGCLVQLLIVSAVGYFGWGAGEVYLKYLNFKDLVENEAQYHAQKSIPDIRNRIKFLADSLEMPAEAGVALVRKTQKQTFIEVHYDDEIILPGYRRDVHFEIKAAGNI